MNQNFVHQYVSFFFLIRFFEFFRIQISTTLSDAKTKYAIFYSACSINNFRNGSIIGDFILGFTRYQNETRLNGFLSRTLVNKQLFGGTILSIIFNATTYVNTNNTDYESEYSTDYGGNTKMLDLLKVPK